LFGIIESCRGLIENQHSRTERKQGSNRESLPFSAAEEKRIRGAERVKTDRR
jgi:hypothetical protein